MKFDQSKFFDNFRDETKQHLAFLNKGFLFLEDGEWNDDTMKQFMRVAHSIKGSARMMGFNSISQVAHRMEDILGAVKEKRLGEGSEVFDALFSGLDCIEAIVTRLSEGGGEDPAACEKVLAALESVSGGKAPSTERDSQREGSVSPVEETGAGAEDSSEPNVGGPKIDTSMFLDSFKEEVKQHVADLNKGILSLEEDGLDDGRIENLMRIAHSVKGISKMLGLSAISDIMHGIEDVFGGLREGTVPAQSDVFDTLFGGLDDISGILENVGDEKFLYEPSGVFEKLTGLLVKLKQQEMKEERLKTHSALESGKTDKPEKKKPPIPKRPEDRETPSSPPPAAATAKNTALAPSSAKALDVDETIRIKTSKLETLVNLIQEMILNQRENEENIKNFRGAYQAIKNLQNRWYALLPYISMPSAQKQNSEDMGRILKTLVKDMGDIFKGGKNTVAHGALIMQGLQQDVMEMRMLPLSTIFDAYPRAVRDLAKQFGKKIRFTLQGAETPLDKTIIEEISDPMVHIIRNAMDHGIETPEERLAAGKGETGNLLLSASQHGDHVSIVLKDDGRGLDVEGLRRHAVQKGFIDGSKIDSFSDKEIIYFITEPGFSTAKKVTDVSGRGVGMDVVRKTVESAKGQILIETTLGKGTTFTLLFPLALAITRALLVKAAGEVFALPTGSVRETLRVLRDDIQQVVDKKAVRLRGATIPVVSLSHLLRLKGVDRFMDYAAYPIIIIESREQPLGIIVDEVLEEQEIVMKNLGEHLRNVRTVAGATILGGGEVVIVLQPPHLLDIARDNNALTFREELQKETSRKETSAGGGKKILLVEDSFNTREMEKLIIESAGFAVDAVANGKEAYAKALEEIYNLIVTDVAMPGMDGIELTRKLKNSPLYKDVPIIILTSRESGEDRKEGLEAGADAYLVKSGFDQDYFVDTIRRFLS